MNDEYAVKTVESLTRVHAQSGRTITEITAKMIDAGVYAELGFDEEDDREQRVIAIFRAMYYAIEQSPHPGLTKTEC